jgi:V8-like Glu-specific endopeptidase
MLAALALLVLIGLTPQGAGATARLRAPSTAATASQARSEAARVARYWTPARMRSAKPLDAGTRDEDIARASFASVLDATVPPYTVDGRIFIRRGGARGFCSGTAINSPTRQLVLTAAHCVNTGPLPTSRRTIWSRFMQFVPAYTNGIAPFGVFVARAGKVFAPKRYVKTGNPNFDVGAFLTFPNAEGQYVADAVGGGVTIAVDQPRPQQFKTFGYPGNEQTLQQCESPYVGDDPLTYRLPGPPTIGIRCRWTPGASGGGWLTEEGTVINGLTSYGHLGDRRHTYSPYFSSTNVGALVAGL